MTGGRTRPYHSKAEPKPASRAPDPPPWLQGPALAAWNSVVGELVALGCVTRLDGPLLAAWASATGRAVEAELMLNELGGPRSPIGRDRARLRQDQSAYQDRERLAARSDPLRRVARPHAERARITGSAAAEGTNG